MVKDLKMENQRLKEDMVHLKVLNAEIGSDCSMLEKKLEYQKITVEQLTSKNMDLQDSLYQLQVRYDKRQNKIDALSERLNKSLKRESDLERELRAYSTAIVKMETRGIMDRILNRIPEDIKQLTSTID